MLALLLMQPVAIVRSPARKYWGYGGGLALGPEKNVGVADVFAGSESVLASTVTCNSRTNDRAGSAIVDDTLSSRCCAVLRLVFA